MGLLDVVSACFRRWYVTVLGIVLALGAIYLLHQRPGVYWARTEVLLQAPVSLDQPNPVTTSSSSLIKTTGVVARRVMGGRDESQPVSPDVRLVDQGIRRGSIVMQPNYGGQWAANFESPKLVVDVAGPDPVYVERETARRLRQITTTLHRIQVDQRVAPVNQITANVSVPRTQVQYDEGRPSRASAMLLLLGGLGTATAAVLEDRRRRRVRPGARDVQSADRPRRVKPLGEPLPSLSVLRH